MSQCTARRRILPEREPFAVGTRGAEELPDRQHSWHLFPIKLRLEQLTIDRNRFIDELKDAGIGCSVHWRPLHLHPYHQERSGWRPEDLPVATAQFERIVSLPLFSTMTDQDLGEVVATLRSIVTRFRR
jgi:perosamine synthetase